MTHFILHVLSVQDKEVEEGISTSSLIDHYTLYILSHIFLCLTRFFIVS